MDVKACIFDLDGTLTRTQESIARPVNMTLEHFGLPAMPVENYNYYAGDGIDNSLRRALKDAGDPELKYFDEGIVLCRKWYQEDPLYHVAPYDHVVDSIRRLKQMGLKIAVFSNKPHLNVRIFGVNKDQVLYFGDTNTDMMTAHNAGVFAVGVCWGFRPREELEKYGADALLEDPSQIAELAVEMEHR